MRILIVGAGISGATLARLLAEKNNLVTIIDERDCIGGNCYDFFNQDGICVHQYGTHIFHTENKLVWDFISRFTKWHPYQHKVLGLIDGMEVPIPFNLHSIEQLFPRCLSEKLISSLINNFGYNVKIPILNLANTKDNDLKFLADYVYEKVFAQYTAKQWGLRPDELDKSVTGRVPVLISRDDRYFQSKYQGIPLLGYTELISRMLNHELISVDLNTEFSHSMLGKYDYIFHSGPIDEFFDFSLGQLPYRSLHFDFQTIDREYFQSNAVINYPCNYDFTRIGEYKYFLNTQSKATVISYEYPEVFSLGINERYYPIINEVNNKQYQKYLNLSKKINNISFFGRLGDYKYYDMDKAIERSMSIAASFCA